MVLFGMCMDPPIEAYKLCQACAWIERWAVC